jgi:D-Tyr-tRNAtyr deacylase
MMNIALFMPQGYRPGTSASKFLMASRHRLLICYSRSARPEVAVPLYEQLIAKLEQDLGRPNQTGEFGADMKVALTNDGPVTIIIDPKSGNEEGP